MTGPKALYSEIDPFAAAWLRNLIKGGHIAPGDVCERDIRDLKPSDIRGYTQFHAFAGIGVWSYALRLAGWPDDRPVWTGSCPCQPFSDAGQGLGFADDRHLWPDWFWLIDQCRPDQVFGEQVASKDGLLWFDVVSSDLEDADYAIGTHDICGAGLGAPHIRQRNYFSASALVDSAGEQMGLPRRPREPGGTFAARRVGEPAGGRCSHVGSAPEHVFLGAPGEARLQLGTFWDACDWIECRDGKSRPVEPGTFPLADGIAERVGQLRAYGNAVIADAARAWIEAFLEEEAAGFSCLLPSDADLIG